MIIYCFKLPNSRMSCYVLIRLSKANVNYFPLKCKAPCKRTQHCWPTTPNIVGCYLLRPFAHPVACCWMLLRVVAHSLKPVKLFSQQLPTFLLFRDRRSVEQQCWMRLHNSSNIVGAAHAHYACFTKTYGFILPTINCRSQHCWELLHPFADHCQHARNNSQHCWRNNPNIVGCYMLRPFAHPVRVCWMLLRTV